MDYKAIINAFLELIKDFLKIVLGEEKYNEVEGDINEILGNE